MATVTWSTDGAISRLRLERPDALNAMSEEMASDFAAAVGRLSREKSKVVVLEGAGSAFCAGGDLDFIRENQKKSAAKLVPLMRKFYGSFLSIRGLPQVTIAKVHGPAVGAGLCLALACDLRAVSDDARLGFNFVRLGINPGMAAWPLARAAVGDARARELLMTGRFFAGRDLAAWGGALAGVDAEELARTVAASSGEALRLLKAETRVGEDLKPYLEREARGQSVTFRGRDLVEGLSAVRERRAPRF